MSFLDLDEWLFELASFADIVFSPIVDAKEFPEDVDATLVEGAVGNEENERFAREVRARSKLVVAFGDCAVTGNVTAMRNPLRTAKAVLDRSYLDPTNDSPGSPFARGVVPPLLDVVRPLHHVVPVDLHLPGCPPSAARIRAALEALGRGETPDLSGEMIRFG